MKTIEKINDLYYIVENGKKVASKVLNQVKGYGVIKNEFLPTKGNRYRTDFLTKADAELIITQLNRL